MTALVSTSRSPGQDGETWQTSRLPMRNITFYGAVTGRGRMLGRARAELMRICNPRLGPGQLTMTAYGRTLCIDAAVDSAPIVSEDTTFDWQTYTMTFACPTPYWTETEDSVVEMTTSTGGLLWPLKLPARFATVKATRRFLVANPGDVECPLVMEFLGGALNPVLSNISTGEAIKINAQVPSTSTLVVETAHGRKRAYLRDNASGAVTDAMGYLDLSSRFFDLAAGDNYLAYDADDGAVAATMRIRWRTRYVGF